MTACSNTFQNQQINYEWHTRIPNMLKNILKNPFIFRVYFEIKSICGDFGYCSMGIKTLAHDLDMSKNTVKKHLDYLAQPFPELGNRPLITMQAQMDDHGGDLPYLIEIVNVWDLNHEIYEKMRNEKEQRKQEKIIKHSFPKEKTRVNPINRGDPLVDPKEERYKKRYAYISLNNDIGGMGGTYEQSPPDRRSLDLNQDIVFDLKTYRLLDGKSLSRRMKQTLAKYSDQTIIEANVRYYERHALNPKTPILDHERYLQNCISKNYALKEIYERQNDLYAKFILHEKKIYGMSILKTVVKFEKESISKSLPPNQFKETIDNILIKA